MFMALGNKGYIWKNNRATPKIISGLILRIFKYLENKTKQIHILKYKLSNLKFQINILKFQNSTFCYCYCIHSQLIF